MVQGYHGTGKSTHIRLRDNVGVGLIKLSHSSFSFLGIACLEKLFKGTARERLQKFGLGSTVNLGVV